MVVFGLLGFDYGNKEIGVQKGYAPEQPIKYSHELHAGTIKLTVYIAIMALTKENKLQFLHQALV
jgi:5,10-methylenetetrahydrofolate reductase